MPRIALPPRNYLGIRGAVIVEVMDDDNTEAAFYGPQAEAHAALYVAMMNARDESAAVPLTRAEEAAEASRRGF